MDRPRGGDRQGLDRRRLPGAVAAQGEKMKELHAFSASISAATHGRFTPQIGGLPITDDDTVIGAMGASGGTGQQDEDVVRTRS